MAKRMRVGVVYGGRSGEHEVSLRSAASIIGALDPGRYEIVPIAIGKDGRWLTGTGQPPRPRGGAARPGPAPDHGSDVTLPADPTRRGPRPARPGSRRRPRRGLSRCCTGTYGEDGTVQGLLELADVPYVGAGVLASAVGMDKAVMKSVFRDAGIPVCRWLVTRAGEETTDALARRVGAELGFPCFVKPANMGSSVGITKVGAPGALAAAVAEAAAYDPKIVIEEAIAGREFECGVLGNEAPEASVIGELVPSHEFYDYSDKYVDQGARTTIPAAIPAQTADAMREMALRAFCAIDCSGLARVDFFLENGTGRILVNEINTMPGFTSISMYPKLWEASGVPYATLLDRLIALAFERHAGRASRRLSFDVPARSGGDVPPRALGARR
jgi:D-alanine-D-alanine ligase